MSILFTELFFKAALYFVHRKGKINPIVKIGPALFLCDRRYTRGARGKAPAMDRLTCLTTLNDPLLAEPANET